MKTPLEVLDDFAREQRRKANACPNCGGVFRHARRRPGDHFIPVLCDGCGLDPIEARKTAEGRRP